MVSVPNGAKILPKISIAWVGRTNVTDRRQTDRQTDGRWHIANMNLSSRSLKTARRKSIRCGTRSQWSSWRRGDTCSLLLDEYTRRAAELTTDCSVQLTLTFFLILSSYQRSYTQQLAKGCGKYSSPQYKYDIAETGAVIFLPGTRKLLRAAKFWMFCVYRSDWEVPVECRLPEHRLL